MSGDVTDMQIAKNVRKDNKFFVLWLLSLPQVLVAEPAI